MFSKGQPAYQTALSAVVFACLGPRAAELSYLRRAEKIGTTGSSTQPQAFVHLKGAVSPSISCRHSNIQTCSIVRKYSEIEILTVTKWENEVLS